MIEMHHYFRYTCILHSKSPEYAKLIFTAHCTLASNIITASSKSCLIINGYAFIAREETYSIYYTYTVVLHFTNQCYLTYFANCYKSK